MTTCDKKTNNINKKTCDKFLDGGMCKLDSMFRCTEYILHREPRLSHSGITNFLRCPQMYYYSNIMGLQVKPEFQSDPLKIGSSVDDYVTNILMGGKPTIYTVIPNGELYTTMWEAKAAGIINAFKELVDIRKVKEMYVGQKEFLLQEDGQPQVKGFIDLESVSGKSFIELKVGKSPAYYTQLFYIRSKLAAYFMSSEAYVSGKIWAIRVPDLKRTGKFKNESLEDYSARIYRVMMKEPTHYFPGYNRKSKNFGVKFGRAEIDLDVTRKTYRMVADWIKLSVKRGVWIKNGTGCLHPFKCDYLPICEASGAVSEDVYTHREKETRGEKIQS